MNLLLALLPFAMVAACAALTLVLFMSVKRDIGERGRAEWELAAIVELLASRVRELEQDLMQPGAPSPAVAGSSRMNVIKRGQALRRMRLGEGSEQIAAALDLPVKEIELLEKVNRIVSSG
jgi:hypothetical protein